MTQPKVLVTGAAGKTGRAVVAELLRAGMPVRALVRRRDDRSAALERAGAEIAVADMFDPDQLLNALKGTRRAYYVPPFDAHAVQAATAFAIAAREAGIEAIVQMSQWLSHRAHPAFLTRQTWLIDRLFAGIPGIAHTIVNPGLFADNFLRLIDFAALLGLYPVLTGAGRAAPVANEDIARVVAAILAAPDRHGGMRYRPTGPMLLSGHDMAAVIAKAVGHRVLSVPMPFWLFVKAARQQGVEPEVLSGYRYYVTEMARGAFEFEGGVNGVVEELTGTPAESFETTARRYAAMPFARQTAANRLKAAAKFALVPVWPGYDLDRWARMRGLPIPPVPSLSIDDARWREEHRLQNAYQPPPRATAGPPAGLTAHRSVPV